MGKPIDLTAKQEMPLCEDCGFWFDPKDTRAQQPGRYGSRCALCKLMDRAVSWGAYWCMSNECQGLFDDKLYETKAAAIKAWDDEEGFWREWRNANGEPAGKVVPVIVVQIPEDHPAHFYALMKNEEREKGKS